MTASFTVTLSPQDLAAAQALALRSHPVRRWAPIAISTTGIAFGALLALAVRHFHPEDTSRQVLSVFAKGMALTMLFLGAQYIMLLGIVGRVVQSASAEPRTISGRLLDGALELSLDGKTEAFVLSAVQRTVEDAQYLVLCRSAANFLAFPKSQLDAATLMALKQALANAPTKPAP